MIWGVLALVAGFGVVASAFYFARDCPSGPRRVVLLGDSLVGGPALPEALRARLAARSAVWAHSYQGQSAAVVAGHLDDALRHETVSDLIILAGVNDLANGAAPEGVAQALSALVHATEARGVRVRLVQIPPWAGHSRYNAQGTALVNSWIAQSRGVTLESMGAAGRLAGAYDGGDGLHLNAQGQARLAQIIAQQAFCR